MANKQEFEPRRADPGQMFGWTDAEGKQVTLKADDDGVIQPKDAMGEANLIAAGLPVARKAKRRPKASLRARSN